MGLLIERAAGSAGGGADWRAGEDKNYAIARLVPLFPTFALIAHYIWRSERGSRSPARDHRIRHVVDSSLFIYLLSLWYFTGSCACPLALAGAVECWGLCAWLLILGWSRFH